MEWVVLIAISAPALVLAVRRSSWLLDYAIFVLAFNRGIRRMVDYYFNGRFNPLSPISLSPLLVAGLLLVPALVHWHQLPKRSQDPFLKLFGALAMGLVIGIVLNRFAAIYSLAEWVSGLAAMLFAATLPCQQKVADRWIKSAGWAAIGVAIYGWWQYYTIPPWDGMWLVQSGMAGYMGQPEPTKMTVFSTLNERGPCGTFMAWAVIPMIIQPRWRNVGGWFSIALLLSGIMLTQTRTNFIIIGLICFLSPALSKGRGLGALVALGSLVVIAASWGIDKIPGMEKMTSRFEADSLYGEGSSLQGRFGIYASGAAFVARHPLGLGLGSSGMGNRAEGGQVETVGDSGYVQIFAQFGWLGGALFFAALWRIWRELGSRWRLGCKFMRADAIDPFVSATRAILIGSLVFVAVGDIFAGFSLLWVLLGRSISLQADPTLQIRKLLQPRRALWPISVAKLPSLAS